MTPHEMTYIDVPQPGPPGSMILARGPLPVPAPGELLIRVLAAGVNRPDVFQRKGFYPPPKGASPILGLEVAGIVAGVGHGVPEGIVGKRVCALTNGGGYAEYVVVPAGQALPWPVGYDAIHAAALPETSFTVWQNLFVMAGLRENGTALVHGGSGGIGTTAIQYATALGATVYVTAGSDDKCAACVELGAKAAINYRTQDFKAEIARLTKGRGVDAILDMVGAPYLERNLASLAEDGKIAFIAFLGGTQVEKLSLGIIQNRRLTLTGSALRPRTDEVKAGIAGALRRVIWPVLDAGLARPVIQQVFPLAAVVEAHQAMEEGDHVGKFVLSVAAE